MFTMRLRRSVAFLIDTTIAGTLARLFEPYLPVSFSWVAFKILGVSFTLYLTLAFVFYVLYFSMFDIVNKGRTIGKLMVGIVTVFFDKNTLKKRLIRSLFKIISMLLLPIAFVIYFRYDYTFQDNHCRTKTVKAE